MRRQRLRRRVVRQGAQDALGPARSARGIQHRCPQPFACQGRLRIWRDSFFVVDVARITPRGSEIASVDNQAALYSQASGKRRSSDGKVDPRSDEHLRLAVVDDIGQFVGSEKGVDAGEVQARALAGSVSFEVAACSGYRSP